MWYIKVASGRVKELKHLDKYSTYIIHIKDLKSIIMAMNKSKLRLTNVHKFIIENYNLITTKL